LREQLFRLFAILLLYFAAFVLFLFTSRCSFVVYESGKKSHARQLTITHYICRCRTRAVYKLFMAKYPVNVSSYSDVLYFILGLLQLM